MTLSVKPHSSHRAPQTISAGGIPVSSSSSSPHPALGQASHWMMIFYGHEILVLNPISINLSGCDDGLGTLWCVLVLVTQPSSALTQARALALSSHCRVPITQGLLGAGLGLSNDQALRVSTLYCSTVAGTAVTRCSLTAALQHGGPRPGEPGAGGQRADQERLGQ